MATNPTWTWPEQSEVARPASLTVTCANCIYWVPPSEVYPDVTIILPSNLVSSVSLPDQFAVINQSGGAGGVSIATPPSAPSFGTSALELIITGTSDHWTVYNYDQIGTLLSSISTLGYSTYSDNDTTAPVLQMEINPGNTEGTDAGVTYSSLNFEPYQQGSGALVEDEWQTWDVLTGKVWGTHLTGAPDDDPITWTEFLSTYPNAQIIGGFGVDVGSDWSATTQWANGLLLNSNAYWFEIESLPGQCHRLSPFLSDASNGSENAFPSIQPTQWCGQWRWTGLPYKPDSE